MGYGKRVPTEPVELDGPRFSIVRVVGTMLATAALGLLGCMGAGFWGDQHWMLDLFNHFYVQYVVIALVGLFVSAIGKRWIATFLFLVALGWSGYQITPLLAPALNPPPARKLASRPDPKPFRVAAVNVLTSNRDFRRATDWILAANADVLVIQETDEAWIEKLDLALQGHRRLETDTIRDDNFGLAVYLRDGITAAGVEVLMEPSQRPWIEATVQRGSESFRLIAVHTMPPARPWGFEMRNAHMTALADLVRKKRSPVIVAGDLNATIWSKSMIELLKKAALRPACHGFGLKGTWPSRLWFTGMILIDHVLVSGTVAVLDHSVGKPIGSDHRGVIVDLELRPR